jgi:hypothetical protein
MEPSRRTSGKHRQISRPSKPRDQAKSVAVGCEWLPRASNGKEGVDGSSLSEGSAKAPQSGAFCFWRTCSISSMRWVWSPLWSLQTRNADARARKRAGMLATPRSIAGARRRSRTEHPTRRGRSSQRGVGLPANRSKRVQDMRLRRCIRTRRLQPHAVAKESPAP